MRADNRIQADGRWLAWGLTLGLLVGGSLALWLAPRSGGNFRAWFGNGLQTSMRRARTRIEDAVPADAVAQSLAEGKEAARKRRDGVLP